MTCGDCEYFCTDTDNKKQKVPFEHCKGCEGYCVMKELFTQQKSTDEACYMFRQYKEES